MMHNATEQVEPVPCNVKLTIVHKKKPHQHKTQLTMHANYAAQITIKQPITKNT